MGISNPLTDRVKSSILRHPQPQPILQTQPELLSMEAQGGTTDGIQPGTCLQEGRGEGQSPGSNVWGRVEQLLVSCLINTVGEGVLSARNINLLEGALIESLGGVSQG